MKKKIILALIFLSLFSWIKPTQASSLDNRLSGRILLQVEAHGEAWYVNPLNKKRYFLGRPQDAFNIMRNLGIGISNQDLEKIPVINSGDKLKIENQEFVNKHQGKIFIQVETHGEAWYVNPLNKKRYFLGRPQDAFNIMRELGLGIKNETLKQISEGEIPGFDFSFLSSKSEPKEITPIIPEEYNIIEIERMIHNLINRERADYGLSQLVWDSELARVARRHSQDLALGNQTITSGGDRCDLPLIHHEGINFGLYNHNRLSNEGVYYFSQTGENIALVSTILTTSYILDQSVINVFDNCKTERSNLNISFKSNLERAISEEEKKQIIIEEVKKRESIFNSMDVIEIKSQKVKTSVELCLDVVNGWMSSPAHRDNILLEEYDQAGIGISFVNGYLIATQVFIKKADCGYNQGPCCHKEGYQSYCFEDLKCQQGICQPAF